MLVGARAHHAGEPTLGSGAILVHVDDALHLRVIEKEAVYGAIATCNEGFGKAPNVETLHTLLAIVAAAKEFDAGIGVV
jgi:hypothetical protein